MPENLPPLRRLKIASDRAGFLGQAFNRSINTIVLPRVLCGDFDAVANAVIRRAHDVRSGYQLDKKRQRAVFGEMARLGAPAMADAARTLLDDLDYFEGAGFTRVNVHVFRQYPKRGAENYRFHADLDATEKGRVICNYNEPLTRYIDNDDVETVSDDGFYRAKPGMRDHTFHADDLVRMASLNRLADYSPSVHRAPSDKGLATPRIMLKADYYRL